MVGCREQQGKHDRFWEGRAVGKPGTLKMPAGRCGSCNAEIEASIATGTPMEKAGAYAIPDQESRPGEMGPAATPTSSIAAVMGLSPSGCSALNVAE